MSTLECSLHGGKKAAAYVWTQTHSQDMARSGGTSPQEFPRLAVIELLAACRQAHRRDQSGPKAADPMGHMTSLTPRYADLGHRECLKGSHIYITKSFHIHNTTVLSLYKLEVFCHRYECRAYIILIRTNANRIFQANLFFLLYLHPTQ